ncbi:RCC1 domain-containing protein [Francisella philomiragia]|uniref:hypothetical protein n=1 Tax=Francisella philomiragia TaxID=28110 RepID=UPI00190632B5|nr:hypothetical protein [Francisella philomiragia]MBK2268304.1 hypothetical protein [Francisella philomiragia]MBK2279701.1 hypothetical protein [Francisella philomiragia]MBK2287615.1 hypothetical protein [Francisella philomiragia]MBK2289594.1 hypothetical protein [Francisella philomiragia]MBK2291492.1 hypothetical protein [Francisella philomiragia]
MKKIISFILLIGSISSIYATDSQSNNINQLDKDCALTEAGNIYCWGNNYYSQAGYNNKEDQYKNGFVNQVFLGGGNPYSDSSYYKLYGFDDKGLPKIEKYKSRISFDELKELSLKDIRLVTINHNADTAFYPNKIQNPKGEHFTKILYSGLTKCAETNTNSLYCWGNGSYGLLGDDKDSNSPIPKKISIKDRVIQAGRVSMWLMYALTNKGDVYIWGTSDSYKNGKTRFAKPTKLKSNIKIKKIYTTTPSNDMSNVALGKDNKLYTIDIDYKIAEIKATLLNFTHNDIHIKKVVSNGQLNCAIDTKYNLYCWGYGGSYGLGYETISQPKDRFGGVSDVFIMSNFNKNKRRGASGAMCIVPRDDEGVVCFGDGTPYKKIHTNFNVNTLGAFKVYNIKDDGLGICFVADYRDGSNALLCMDDDFDDVKVVVKNIKFYNNSCAVDKQGKLYCWGFTGDGLGAYGYGISRITKYIDGGSITTDFSTHVPTHVYIPPKAIVHEKTNKDQNG